MEKGKIIILNGVSASGKTTLAKSLQELISEPYLRVAIDTFVEMLPDKNKHIGRTETDFIQKFESAFLNIIKACSDSGFNVIVDHVLMKFTGSLEKYTMLLHDYTVLFVHVTCSLEELRRREKKRHDSLGTPLAFGEDQILELDPQDTYDITVDTSNETIEECANKIIELMDYPEKLTAFITLWKQHA